MFSMPPAMARSMWPSQISCAADAIACAPEPQTRLTVIAGTATGTPPLSAACRAGFIRLPAWTTLPITTLPIRAESTPERSEEHTSELQSRLHLVCRLLLEKKKRHKRANREYSH